MAYELWDMASHNAIAGFPTEDEALAAVRREIDGGGAQAVDTWFLGYEDARGRSRAIAQGAQLAERARARSTSVA